MRVLCVNGFNIGYIGKTSLTRERQIATANDIIIEGNVYTVTDTLYFNGEKYYELAERPKICVYWSERFIPLSDIDETELVNEKEETYA